MQAWFAGYEEGADAAKGDAVGQWWEIPMSYGERLGSGRRGRFSPVELVAAATERGHASLGRAPAGRIAVGAPCDLVELRTDTPRTAGALAEQVPLAAGAADVRTVIVDGEPVVGEGRHLALDEVGMALAEVIGKLWS